MPPPSQIAALIAQAANLINQGQWAFAEQALAQVLGARPLEPDGLQLMGMVRASQGRNDEAEALYRQSLSLRPRQANVQANLGKLLTATGRAQEGIALLRGALRADPNNFDLLLVLAQAQQAAGELVFAEKNLVAALKLAPNDLSAMLSLGALYNDTHRPAEGETVLRKALALDCVPAMRAALEHNLGVALKMQRRYDEALAHLDAALARAPDLPFADANRASVLQHLDRQDEAVAAYRRAIARNPLHLPAHQELNALLYRMGRDEAFLKSYDEAAVRVRNSAALQIGKGRLLNRTGRFAEARECFERAAIADPGSAVAQNGLAISLVGLKQFEPAVAAYEKSLALQPGDIATQVNLAGTLLQVGEFSRALGLAEAVVAGEPDDQGALAVYELALRANGDARADLLADYERQVQIFDLDPPDGFASMADFNAALNARLDNLHRDRREHIDQTLRHGTQTMEPLFDGSDALIAALRGRIEQAVATYIARMAGSGKNPLSARRRHGFRFSGSWSSRLHDCGFHTNHIHPKGWISSCYYVAVPDVVEDAQARQGWIKFGEPAFAMALRDPIRRAVKPAPGRLVLFPSYMWHGTVPFHSASARTTIAFDAIPD